MIIWNRFGILVVLVTFASLLGAEYSSESLFRDTQYFQHHGWPGFLACLLSAAATYGLAQWLERRYARLVVDPAGKRSVIYPPDSLFFIPVRYCPYLLVALGLAFLVLVH